MPAAPERAPLEPSVGESHPLQKWHAQRHILGEVTEVLSEFLYSFMRAPKGISEAE
jgi:hypothetical protein